jgi:ADP-ribosylglycohydrolase
LTDFAEAIWQTLSGGGDCDTNCAIVGGIVVLYVGQEGIPTAWLNQREALPGWAVAGGG